MVGPDCEFTVNILIIYCALIGCFFLPERHKYATFVRIGISICVDLFHAF